MNLTYFVLAIVWSALFTGALLFVRSRVRANRQRLIDELGILFFPGQKSSSAAFDYVRAKYELTTLAERQRGAKIRPPTSTGALLVASLPYMVLCALGFIILFVPKPILMTGSWGVPMLYDNMFWTMAPGHSTHLLLESAAVYSAAFLGGYLMTARVLLRAVQNYELSQLTFLQAAAHLAFGLVGSMMVYHILRQTGLEGLFADRFATVDAFPGFLLLAFMGGYMPDLGITNLSRRLRVRWLKTVDDESLNSVAIMPLEMLDGIDYDIRYRLEQSGFYDVQNLAVANPLLIYVETPYALYEAFDWVLQAQLCVAVGGPAFRDLKEHRIRTSLDLERAVLGDDATDQFILSVGRVLFPGSRSADGVPAGDPFSADSIRHGVMVMLDDLHVHRMRALWDHIFGQITEGTNRQWIYRSTPGLAVPVPRAAPVKEAPKVEPGEDQPSPDEPK